VTRWWLAIVVLICGCVPSNGETQLVSDRFGVCINLPRGSTYSDYNQYVDYDTATLHIKKSTVEVMIGGHPQFSRRAIENVTQAAGRFRLLGEERTDGKDKLLFGINRRNLPVVEFYGPENELVMFSSTNMKSIRPLLLKDDVVIDCRKPAHS